LVPEFAGCAAPVGRPSRHVRTTDDRRTKSRVKEFTSTNGRKHGSSAFFDGPSKTGKPTPLLFPGLIFPKRFLADRRSYLLVQFQ
jgi:hypothetical protein